ncbi:CBS domain-containing protein [Kroppenstedtia pulmonis]|uniref:CBS domain-containing protein n=1 Tax=Kroppenstedtia pulmonis TaxID=1380685 RepID=A0A7D4BKG6_9BACL|nr:CBS domain-containing protein [Kroppenstedtia pulmonis]QKG84890.1 CBS domain-containing protein [Kroppenstedtia pulmonis]
MFIKNCLTPKDDIVTVTPDTPLGQALDMLDRKQLHSLPVVDENGSFIGITGYSFIFKKLLEQYGHNMNNDWIGQKVEDTVHEMTPIRIDGDFEETFPVIVRYPFVPVVDEDDTTFLGIVKISDIETVITSTYGHNLPGVRFVMAIIPDVPHQLEQILDSVKSFDVNIISVVTFDAGDSGARRILLKISPTEYTAEIQEYLESKGFRVLSMKVLPPFETD